MFYKKDKINKSLAGIILSLFLFIVAYLLNVDLTDVFYKNTDIYKPQQDVYVEEGVFKEEGKVKFVVDGDTFILEDGRKVRLIGIDTPEFGRKYSATAKQKMFELVFRKNITLVRDVSEYDKYGRILRYVYVGDKFVNLEMVEGGYARVLTILPDTKYSEQFTKAQDKAREEKLGIWVD